MATPPEAEFMLRLEQLRRDIDNRARRAALQFVAALVVAFALGWLAGRYWR